MFLKYCILQFGPRFRAHKPILASDQPKRDFAASAESEALAEPFAEASAEYRSFG